jgi:hypothetical protein
LENPYYSLTAIGLNFKTKKLEVMTNIVQLNYDDLQAVIKDCLCKSIEEIKNLPIQEEKPDRCTLPDAVEITGLKKSALYKMYPSDQVGHRIFKDIKIFA